MKAQNLRAMNFLVLNGMDKAIERKQLSNSNSFLESKKKSVKKLDISNNFSK